MQAASLYILQHPDHPAPLGFVSARWMLVKMATRLIPDSRNVSFDELPPSLASEEVAVAVNDEGVEMLLASLTPRYRYTLQARYCGYGYATIARCLHVTPRTVQRWQAQALSLLGLERACSEGSAHSERRSAAPI